jgi:hypothetical protein
MAYPYAQRRGNTQPGCGGRAESRIPLITHLIKAVQTRQTLKECGIYPFAMLSTSLLYLSGHTYCIAHFRVDGSFRTEAHVFVSADRSHDTYLVQGIMDDLADHFAARGIIPSSWYFHTDGAPSHYTYKNKFTVQSLFRFKKRVSAHTILWATCAPGHGKGPWDGIGAVVKQLLARLER